MKRTITTAILTGAIALIPATAAWAVPNADSPVCEAGQTPAADDCAQGQLPGEIIGRDVSTTPGIHCEIIDAAGSVSCYAIEGPELHQDTDGHMPADPCFREDDECYGDRPDFTAETQTVAAPVAAAPAAQAPVVTQAAPSAPAAAQAAQHTAPRVNAGLAAQTSGDAVVPMSFWDTLRTWLIAFITRCFTF